MGVISGNISGSVSTIPFNIPCDIVSARFVNRSINSIALNVYVATSGGDREITPLNYIIISGTIYIIDQKVRIRAGDYLIIVSSGSLDYYITVE